MRLVATKGSDELALVKGAVEYKGATRRVAQSEESGLHVALYFGEKPAYGDLVESVLPQENPFIPLLQKLRPGEQKNMLTLLTHALDEARSEVTEDDLEAAIAELRPSPAMAAAKASAQGTLDRLNQDPKARLLTAGEMADYVDKKRNWPSESARKLRLISVRHAAKTYYPAFQIDPVHRETWDWVSTMARILENEEITGRSFTLWAATPSPRFDGDTPATHTGDPDFMAKAAADLAEL